MNKKVIKLIFGLGGAILLFFGAWVYTIIDYGTPDEFSKEEWPNTKSKAKQVTIEYFKKEKDIDVVITEVGFSGEYASHEVYLDGYVSGNEQQKISVIVDSSKQYKVISRN